MVFAKLHPLLVHFPVGLLVSGALFELYGGMRGDEVVKTAGRFNVRLGFYFVWPVLAVGLIAAINLDVPVKAKPFLGYHMLGAFSSAVMFIAVMLIGRFGKSHAMGLIRSVLLGAGLFSVLATGYFGGELVHRHGLPQAALENTSR
jgi:uncharacterized membrane protein